MMTKQNIFGLIVVTGLLALMAIASRFALVDLPNFKPVVAIAIFLGFYSQNSRVALATVLVVMLITDSVIGFYSLPLMISVYSAVLLAVFLGKALQPLIQNHKSVVTRSLSVVGASLLASLLFFAITNFAVCFFTPWYPNTANGLLDAFVSGIPFFRFTVAGNVLFTLFLFSSYFLATHASRRCGVETQAKKAHQSA